MPGITTTNFRDSDGVDLGRKLVTKDYLLEVYGTILENSPASGLVVTPELWAWGRNHTFQLGIINTNGKVTPVTTFAGGTTWKQVSSGYNFTAAVKTDGTLWCWGDGGSGRLGDGTGANRQTPVTTSTGGTTWKQVSAGSNFTAAIKTDGTLWGWGYNGNGQLGDNSVTNRFGPVVTSAGGTTWKQVSCGGFHTAAIKTDGSLWLWGASNSGQLGTNNLTPDRITPITTFIGGTDWKSVDCGQSHTAAIKTDGSLWIWGSAGGGLGINNTASRSIPVTTFAGGNNWKQVSCGYQYTAAIKTDGSLWNWGRNNEGQLGINNTDQKNTPVTTLAGGTNWKQVSSKFPNGHPAAIKTDGTLWTWGSNSYGELGDATGTRRSIPVTTFAGGNNWKQVSSGRDHTAAIQTIDYI